ncbi:hypothetical protein L1887_19989 [Cichorium endivia]|nr:hypothetical protein L1887_19989 [Cichorium endivia]
MIHTCCLQTRIISRICRFLTILCSSYMLLSIAYMLCVPSYRDTFSFIHVQQAVACFKLCCASRHLFNHRVNPYIAVYEFKINTKHQT